MQLALDGADAEGEEPHDPDGSWVDGYLARAGDLTPTSAAAEAVQAVLDCMESPVFAPVLQRVASLKLRSSLT